MRKYGYLFILIIILSLGVATSGTNFEFKTVNQLSEQYTNTQLPSYEIYKKQQELENGTTCSIDNEESTPQQSQNIQKQLYPSHNYSVYTPQEYIPTDYSKEAVLFIMDFSGSMLNKVGGKRKIDMALDTMHNLLPRLAPQSQLGLRLYGHRSSFTPIESCLVSDLVVPIAPNSSQKIYNALKKADAKGNTPITYSLKQAYKKDFAKFTGRKRIVLLTDGGENCDESPCQYATKVLAKHKDLSIDVIAFDINNADANAQLKCTALVTSGKFYKADTEAQLVNSLKDSMNIQKDVQGVILKTP